MLTIFTVTILEAILEAITILVLILDPLLVLLTRNRSRTGVPIIVDSLGLATGLTCLVFFLRVVQFGERFDFG